MQGGTSDGVLTTVVSVDPIYVYVDADENSVLKYMKLRNEGKRVSARDEPIPAYVELANETGFPHEGYIDFVDNRLDPSTGTQRARGVFKNWDPRVAPGFFVRMRVLGAEKYKAVLIDDKVISSQQGVKFVFVVKPDNTVERRNIETGQLFEGLRIVKSGLKGWREGDFDAAADCSARNAGTAGRRKPGSARQSFLSRERGSGEVARTRA
jgi:multidrug efflux system membrane fusion protein